MSLRFAILTALTERAATGSELARRFDRSIGYFWPASHQQIYRELDRLADDALIVEVESDEPAGRGQPRTFDVTTSGTQALTAWLTELSGPPPVRDAMLVRMRAAAVLGRADDVVPALRERLALHRQNLETYRGFEERDFDGDVSDPADLLRRRILRSGIELERLWVQWCTEALAELGVDQADPTLL